MDEVEVVVKRKVTKLAKAWAPVLVLMGLLIAVDTFDSVPGSTFLTKIMHLSLGFATHDQQHHHLDELPPHTTFPSKKKTNVKSSKYWKARHLLHRPTPASATDPAPVLTPHLTGPDIVPPPPPSHLS